MQQEVGRVLPLAAARDTAEVFPDSKGGLVGLSRWGFGSCGWVRDGWGGQGGGDLGIHGQSAPDSWRCRTKTKRNKTTLMYQPHLPHSKMRA